MKAKLDFLDDTTPEIESAFWEALGGRPDAIAPPMADDGPTATEEERLQYKLWHISDDSGSV